MDFSVVKIFSETKFHERNQMGERITNWLADNPDLVVVDKIVTQSSDEAYHCLTVTLFCEEAA